MGIKISYPMMISRDIYGNGWFASFRDLPPGTDTITGTYESTLEAAKETLNKEIKEMIERDHYIPLPSNPREGEISIDVLPERIQELWATMLPF